MDALTAVMFSNIVTPLGPGGFLFSADPISLTFLPIVRSFSDQKRFQHHVS